MQKPKGEKAEIEKNTKLYSLQLKDEAERKAFELKQQRKRNDEEEEKIALKATQDLQDFYETIQQAELARERAKMNQRLDGEKAVAELEMKKQNAYAETIKSIMASISPELIAAITTGSEMNLLVISRRVFHLMYSWAQEKALLM